MKSLTLQTCAKINFNLRVLARRTDGFHSVETVLHTIGLWDELRLRAHDVPGEIVLTVAGEALAADESNLCWRAARLLGGTMKSPPGVAISLTKAIPVGTGLGGGSSDAAATLLGLCRLWEVELSEERLVQLAGELGADVPFFLKGGCALATEHGERLAPLPSISLSLVVVVPERRISTAQAYAALGRGASLSRRRGLSRVTQRAVQAVRSGEPTAVAAALHNDFEAISMLSIAEAREVKAALLKAGCLGALLSGSGSAVFGLAPDHARAEVIAGQLRARWPWVRVTSTVAADESMIITERSEEPVA